MTDPEVGADVPVETSEAPPGEEPKRRGRLWLFLLLAAVVLAGALALFFAGTGYGYTPLTSATIESNEASAGELLQAMGDAPPHTADEAEKLLQKIRPKGVFIVIDRVQNRLHLRDGDQTLLTAVISAGAGSILEDPSGKRSWVFDTPLGRFYVKAKRENPLWTAPDWEYIESGEPLPKHYSDRVQEGMLGEYAFDLGGGPTGYMIHGTLYTRLLGRNVSHGCIRVGRDDLRVLWKKVPIGSAVYMY